MNARFVSNGCRLFRKPHTFERLIATCTGGDKLNVWLNAEHLQDSGTPAFRLLRDGSGGKEVGELFT